MVSQTEQGTDYQEARIISRSDSEVTTPESNTSKNKQTSKQNAGLGKTITAVRTCTSVATCVAKKQRFTKHPGLRP